MQRHGMRATPRRPALAACAPRGDHRLAIARRPASAGCMKKNKVLRHDGCSWRGSVIVTTGGASSGWLGAYIDAQATMIEGMR